MMLTTLRRRNDLTPWFSLFNNFVDQTYDRERTGNPMAMDILENETGFVVRANLPGISREEVRISIQDNQIVLEAKRNVPEEKTGKVVFSERYLGNFQRCLTLPESADMDNVRAKMENGVLELSIPKKREKAPKEIQIQ